MGLFDILFGDPRPRKCDGYTINYSDPYWSPCPFHDRTTYQTVEEPTLAYCPKCKRLLVHEDDRTSNYVYQ